MPCVCIPVALIQHGHLEAIQRSALVFQQCPIVSHEVHQGNMKLLCRIQLYFSDVARSAVYFSGVSIRRKDRLWDHLGTPER